MAQGKNLRQTTRSTSDFETRIGAAKERQVATAPHLTLSSLESHLWEAANILRGPVDAADFKTYVFPLPVFKRISDVHDEEYTDAVEESSGDEEYAQSVPVLNI